MSQKYKPSDYEQKEKEVLEAISCLKHHGLSINLPESIQRQLDHTSLFDGDDALFKRLLPEVEVYFEYGCGKSTEYVYKYSNAKIFAVDTSQEWASKVKAIAPDSNRLHVSWVDVGKLADWGNPVSFEKRHNFSKYTDDVWTHGESPDLVVVDGRFRVCSFLTTLKNAKIGTKVIFDDYSDRPFYHVAEEFLPVVDRCGRQALFIVDENCKSLVTDQVICEFRNVIA